MFIYFEREREEGRDRERGKENLKQVSAVDAEPDMGLNTTNCEIMT